MFQTAENPLYCLAGEEYWIESEENVTFMYPLVTLCCHSIPSSIPDSEETLMGLEHVALLHE